MYVDLRGCRQITNSDLIHFSNTKILNLSGCYLITDISALSHLEALNISNCEYIMDASPLSKLSTLILSGCDFCATITRIGPLKAYNYMLKYQTIENLKNIIYLPDDFKYQEARDIFYKGHDQPVEKILTLGTIKMENFFIKPRIIFLILQSGLVPKKKANLMKIKN